MPDKPKSKPFSTIFGVSVPKWQQEKLGAGSATITFVLQGRMPSKKNRQMVVVEDFAAKKWLADRSKKVKKLSYGDFAAALGMTRAKFIGNRAYHEAKAKYIPVLQQQMEVWKDRLAAKGLVFPIKSAAMTVKFYFRDGRITDTVNKQQTVQDLLQEAGVIANDDYKTLNPISAASVKMSRGIRENISLIRLSVKLPKKNIQLTDELR